MPKTHTKTRLVLISLTILACGLVFIFQLPFAKQALEFKEQTIDIYKSDQKVDVVVARKSVVKGALIKQTDIETKTVDVKISFPDALHNTVDVVGKVAVRNIESGEILTEPTIDFHSSESSPLSD